MKAKIGDLIWYMRGGKIHSAKVLSKLTIETSDVDACTIEQRNTFEPFGKAGVKYATCHGQFSEEQIFTSKEALVESLLA